MKKSVDNGCVKIVNLKSNEHPNALFARSEKRWLQKLERGGWFFRPFVLHFLDFGISIFLP
jgi:hypothetical protein